MHGISNSNRRNQKFELDSRQATAHTPRAFTFLPVDEGFCRTSLHTVVLPDTLSCLPLSESPIF